MPATTSTLAELPASPVLRRNDRSTEEHAVATPFPPLTRSLRWNMLYALVGNGAYNVAQGGFLVILARLNSPAAVGDFAYGLAITAPIFMLVSLQLRQLIAGDAGHELALKDLLGLRLLTTLFASVVSCGVAFCLGETPSATYAIAGMALFKSVEAISQVLTATHQRSENFDRSTTSSLLRAAASLSLVLVAAWFWPSAGNCSIAAAIGALAVIITYDLPVAARLAGTTHLWPRFRSDFLWTILWRGLPLGIAMMLLGLLPNIPRYFVRGELGVSELGIYSALGFLGNAGTIVMSAVCQPALPRLARYHLEQRRADFARLVASIVGGAAVLGLSLVLGAAVFGAAALGLIYGPEYASHHHLLIWQMVATTASLMTVAIGTAVTASRQIALQPVIVLMATLVCSAGCWLLVPVYGLHGAAWALCIAWCFCFMGYLLLLCWKSKHS